MSNASTAIAWAHSNASTTAAKLVLLKIADMDGDGGAWPAMDTLAAAGMVTRDAARKIVRRLEDLGEIRTHINEGGGLRTQKHMRTNRYEFLLRCPWYCDGTTAHRDLRDTKNSAWRPAHWEELQRAARGETHLFEAVDNSPETPQPQELPPAPGRGAPQPQELPNHNLTNNNPKELKESNSVTTGAREIDKEGQVKDDFTDWKPHKQVAEVKRNARRATRQPAPKPAVKLALNRTKAEQVQVDELRTLDCAARPGFKHWIPPNMPGCVSPGCNATITEAKDGAA